MPPVLSPLLDALIFIGLAWVLWRGLGRAFPIAVMPIVIGMLLAATGWLPREWGVPSWLGDRVGWIGVLLLAFTAGLETRQMGAHGADATTLAPSPLRLVLSAGVALALPFAVGALAAYHLFARLPDWAAPNGNQLASALGIGLCVAVSALPVLIGIVRELGPPHRRLTSVALRLAVIDDAVLWIGLALLLLYTRQGQGGFSWSGLHLLALAIPLAMLLLGPWLGRRALPAWAVWLAMPLYLAAGAWASTRLGLHELLGAYFAGALMPATWLRAVPVERTFIFGLAEAVAQGRGAARAVEPPEQQRGHQQHREDGAEGKRIERHEQLLVRSRPHRVQFERPPSGPVPLAKRRFFPVFPGTKAAGPEWP